MARLQLLVAIVVEGRAAVEVQAFRSGLGDRRLDRIAPHVTLAPPSAVAESDLAAVVAHLRAAARLEAPFALSLGPPTSFAPLTPTIHLPVADPDGRLGALRAVAGRAPMRQERRLFAPHVTLSSGETPERIDAACRVLAGYHGTLAVERLSLLTRAADRPGWITLEDIDLDGVRTAGAGVTAIEFAAGSVVGPAAGSLVAAALAAGGTPPRPPLSPPSVTTAGDLPLVITARRAGSVVGVAWGEPLHGPDGLAGVAVDGPFRREGIGGMLAREWEFRRRWRAARDEVA